MQIVYTNIPWTGLNVVLGVWQGALCLHFINDVCSFFRRKIDRPRRIHTSLQSSPATFTGTTIHVTATPALAKQTDHPGTAPYP